MNPNSGHIPTRTIDKLRAAHQSAAKLAAATGRVPASFLGDPTFQELIVGVKSDKPANSSD